MSNIMISQAISAVLALGLAGSVSATQVNTPAQNEMAKAMGNIKGMEKCYGVAKAGRNDCATASHGCAGESKIEKDPSAWILVPTGTCDKIAVSSMHAPEKT